MVLNRLTTKDERREWMITYVEVMEKLRELGSEQTKQTFIRHGAKEPIFDVKVGDLKMFLVKHVKKIKN